MPTEREIAASILGSSLRIISTERGQQHGDLAGSFTLIAEWWNTYIKHKARAAGIQYDIQVPLDDVDVLEMMSMVKKARNIYGSPIPDHSVDDAGYTALAAGIRLHEQINRKTQEETAAKMQQMREEYPPTDSAPTETAHDADPPTTESPVPIPSFLRQPKTTKMEDENGGQ